MSTEAEVVSQLTRDASIPATIDQGPGFHLVAIPASHRIETVDLSNTLPAPVRSRGRVELHDGPSFIEAVKLRQLDGVRPVVYVDEANHRLTAILNDDHGSVPGWRDYRVNLRLARTPEWEAWRFQNDKAMVQAAFAEMLEERIGQITTPPGAVMLELAQQVEGSASAEFSAGARLQNGARQVVWRETVKATAANGTIEIPDRFTITVPVFVAATPIDVTCLLRFRINGGHLQLQYRIVDLAAIELAEFTRAVGGILAESENLFDTLHGVAPE